MSNRPIPKPTDEIGETGLQRFSGRILEDFLKELQGIQGYKRFNEMRLNSPVIGALLRSINLSIRKVDWLWTSDQGEDDPRLQIIADSLENMRHSWNDHISEVLTMAPFGFSMFEVVYERIDARLLWHKLAFRGQDTVQRWLFDDKGGLEGFEQTAAPLFKFTPIPIQKLIIYRTTSEKNNPEGRSVLRTAWVPYYYVKNLQQIEAIGVERDVAGLPVITGPEGADMAEDGVDFQRASKLGRRVRNDEQAAVVVPFGWTFELAGSTGTKNFNVDVIIKRYESRMLMTALAQFLLLGQDRGAGLSENTEKQTNTFNDSVNALADIIAETIVKFLLPPLMRLNGVDADGLNLEHTPAGDTNIDELSKALDLLKKSGLFTPTIEDEIFLREMTGMPDKTAEEIEEAQEMERDRAAQIAAAFKPQTAESQPDGRDEMEAVMKGDRDDFVSGKSPDDRLRRKNEKSWRNTLTSFFRKQKKRITGEVDR